MKNKKNFKKLNDEEVKKVAGGNEVGQYIVCPSCGEGQTITESYTCKNCGASLQDSYYCLAAGTQILMADGTTKAVEDIRPHDRVASWDFDMGASVETEIIHNSHLGMKEQTSVVIDLQFSENTCISVINGHCFFDITEDKYVTLDENAEKFIGHEFVKIDNSGFGAVKLEKVYVHRECAYAYSPIARKTINCITNGMLSASSYFHMFLNAFDVDANKLIYVNKASDIEAYGLLKHDAVAHILTEAEFDALNGEIAGVAFGKGLCKPEQLEALAKMFSGELKNLNENLNR